MSSERHGGYTADSFAQRVAVSPQGERIVYHVGSLHRDPLNSVSFTAAERRRINNVAGAAFKMFKNGTVHLVQRRVADGFEYIAIKR